MNLDDIAGLAQKLIEFLVLGAKVYDAKSEDEAIQIVQESYARREKEIDAALARKHAGE